MNQWFSNYYPENFLTDGYWFTESGSSGGEAIVVEMVAGLSGSGGLAGETTYTIVTPAPRSRSQVI